MAIYYVSRKESSGKASSPYAERHTRGHRHGSRSVIKDSGHSTSTEINIHVYDERRAIHRDFECSKSLVISQIKYFKSYLADKGSQDKNIDVTVHCDCFVFEWLMNFIHNEGTPPKLNLDMLLPVLVASDFLQMDTVFDFCTKFMSANLQDVLKMQIDFSFLRDDHITRLAQYTPAEELARIKDEGQQPQITSRLFKAKIETSYIGGGCDSHTAREKNKHSKIPEAKKDHQLNRSTLIECCKHCGRLYVDSDHPLADIVCSNSVCRVGHR
eukprot:2779533-Ditylum_brightwellii.AAC.1